MGRGYIHTINKYNKILSPYIKHIVDHISIVYVMLVKNPSYSLMGYKGGTKSLYQGKSPRCCLGKSSPISNIGNSSPMFLT